GAGEGEGGRGGEGGGGGGWDGGGPGGCSDARACERPRRNRRLLQRQAHRLPLLLPMGAAAHRAAARSPRFARLHLPRRTVLLAVRYKGSTTLLASSSVFLRVASGSRDQGTLRCLGLPGSRRSPSSGQLRRISTQHRSAATRFP